ncbi:glycosyltransferase family 4 protein [Planctomyces sp. SH-PL62]|uniref:glycosyltransferase family 4 protein n=1 Tax=Planctomyces sp. SH-PL62 TaxID=1636152 RepID=UPI00078CBDA6|nr:glycosyltransferase family 4 protein [Planctomyces sp. SH-PL62]AMV39831.1 Lipopolysaccharide core biosynthesis protein RfaG [Planctomyces sp. SH-PL62]
MRLALNFPRVDPTKGGAETYIVDLCRSLTRSGHQVDLFTSSWAEGALPAEVRCIRVESPGRTRREQVAGFAEASARLLKNADYDCTIGFINTYEHDVIIPQGGVHRGSLRANSLRFGNALTRRLYVMGKVLNPKFWTYRAIEKRQYAADRGARVVAASRMVARHVQEFEGVPKSRIHVVPNAIDPDRVLVPQPGALRCVFRDRIGLAPDDLVGLFVGHNYALKGLEPLIRGLAARNKPGVRPIHLLICGGGRPGWYRRLAQRLGVGEFVHFLGFHDDVRECYWSSDFFISPTYYDPCSLVVLEALACGLPAVTTACNGASELMDHGRQGFVLSAPDARDELVAALDGMADESRRRAMSIEAAKLGREWTFDRHVEALVKVFREVAAARAKSATHGRRPASGPHAAKVGNRKKAGRG